MKKALKKWILIVDDDADLVNVHRTLLELHFGDSAKFIEAYDGIQGTARVAFQAFDLILTDISMPKKEGNAFIQSIRESALNAETPIIVCSGFSEDLSKAFKHVSTLDKPVNHGELVKVVETQLKLGRKTDSRVAADLLNAVILSAQQLIERESGTEPDLLAPIARKKNDEIEGDYLQAFSIKIGSVTNDFVIGVNRSTFEKLTNGIPDEKISDIVGKLLIKHAIKLLKSHSEKISILNTQSLDKNSLAYKELKRKCGIVVPLQKKNSEGRLLVQALWDRTAA